MNWEQIEGKWSQVKGEIRRKWGKLTDDDLEVIAGSKDKFVEESRSATGSPKRRPSSSLTIGSKLPPQRSHELVAGLRRFPGSKAHRAKACSAKGVDPKVSTARGQKKR